MPNFRPQENQRFFSDLCRDLVIRSFSISPPKKRKFGWANIKGRPFSKFRIHLLDKKRKKYACSSALKGQQRGFFFLLVIPSPLPGREREREREREGGRERKRERVRAIRGVAPLAIPSRNSFFHLLSLFFHIQIFTLCMGKGEKGKGGSGVRMKKKMARGGGGGGEGEDAHCPRSLFLFLFSCE